MTLNEIMNELEKLATAATKEMWIRHGASEPLYGVNIGKLKTLIKDYQLRNNTSLALKLYDTENIDAMYLAGLIVNPKELSIDQLKHWGVLSRWSGTNESIVPWCAAESGLGFELAKYWLSQDDEKSRILGYSTLGNVALYIKDEDLDISYFEKHLDYISKHIHDEPNRLRYAMNNYVIAVGSGIESLSDKAKQIGNDIGEVKVYMGNTACLVPNIEQNIEKSVNKHGKGFKKKKVRC